MKNNAKAVAMLSSGLDSTVAIRLMLDQRIAVHNSNRTPPAYDPRRRWGWGLLVLAVLVAAIISASDIFRLSVVCGLVT